MGDFSFFDFSKNIFCLRKVYLQKNVSWNVESNGSVSLEAVHCTLYKSWNLQRLQPSQACVFGVTNSLPRLQPAKAMVKACIQFFINKSLQKLQSKPGPESFFCNKVAKATRIFQWLQPSLASNLLVGKGLQLITACTGYSQATKKPAKAAACTG